MTIQKILVPDMGDFKDVEVIEVLVKKGQVIKKNDSLITLESDKSSVEVPATHEGKIEKINVSVGDKINKGDLILTLESKQETNEPVMVIMAHAGHTPVLDDLFPFPTEPFNGKIRMNINSFQSTSMLDVVDNEFIEGWLKPTYDKLEPFPYVGDEELVSPEPQTGNRQGPTFNFAYGDVVTITSGSNGRSNIIIKNPKQTLAYEVWNPLTPFSNRKLLQSAAIVTLTDVYTIFKNSEKRTCLLYTSPSPRD